MALTLWKCMMNVCWRTASYWNTLLYEGICTVKMKIFMTCRWRCLTGNKVILQTASDVREEIYLLRGQSYNLLIEWSLPLLLSFNRFVWWGKQVPLVNVSNCPSCLRNLVHPSLSCAVTPCRLLSQAGADSPCCNRWGFSHVRSTRHTICRLRERGTEKRKTKRKKERMNELHITSPTAFLGVQNDTHSFLFFLN